MLPSPLATDGADKPAETGSAADDFRLRGGHYRRSCSAECRRCRGRLGDLGSVEALAFARDRASHVFGLFYFSIGETRQSLVWFERALELRPAFPEALSARAAALQKLGQPQEALAGLVALLQLDPRSSEAPFMSGAIYQSLGQRQ